MLNIYTVLHEFQDMNLFLTLSEQAWLRMSSENILSCPS